MICWWINKKNITNKRNRQIASNFLGLFKPKITKNETVVNFVIYHIQQKIRENLGIKELKMSNLHILQSISHKTNENESGHTRRRLWKNFMNSKIGFWGRNLLKKLQNTKWLIDSPFSMLRVRSSPPSIRRLCLCEKDELIWWKQMRSVYIRWWV